MNDFTSASVPLAVGGNLVVNMENENAPAPFDPSYLEVAGSFRYRGSSEVDQVEIGNGYIDVRGKATIALGDGVTGSGDPQFVRLKASGGLSHRFAGLVTSSAGDSTNGDRAEVQEAIELMKGMKRALGDGTNTVTLSGNAGKVQSLGGAGQDSATLGLAAPSAKIHTTIRVIGIGSGTFDSCGRKTPWRNRSAAVSVMASSASGASSRPPQSSCVSKKIISMPTSARAATMVSSGRSVPAATPASR